MFGIIPYANRPAIRNNTFANPFNEDFFRSFFGTAAAPANFSVDVEDKGDSYLLRADLPGVDKDKVKVTVENGVMTISAETEAANEETRGNYVVRERRTGSMRRAFSLEGVTEEGITAEYKDGVLNLTLPKEKPAIPAAREITIN